MPAERKLTMGSLFAGIGGFDLGFTRAGFDVTWQVEIDPWCRKVLAKNFPNAERYADIRECGRHNLKPVDVICGGFPCQDISNAGLRAGIEGERSGLVTEMVRVIRELRPRGVLMENVSALLGRGMGAVLGYLAEIGYDAEWEVVSAADVGAPHLRERVWVLAYPTSAQNRRIQQPRIQADTGASGEVAHASRKLPHGSGLAWGRRAEPSDRGEDATHSYGARLQVTRNPGGFGETAEGIESGAAVDGNSWWAVEPNVGRVAHGVSKRVDRLRGLGNAVVPQIPELYAKRIASALEATDAR